MINAKQIEFAKWAEGVAAQIMGWGDFFKSQMIAIAEALKEAGRTLERMAR
jgi:hypothetical protein